MRKAFLDTLTQTFGQMCGLAGLAMERATQALLQADLTLTEQVTADHDHDQLLSMRTKAEDDAHPSPAICGKLSVRCKMSPTWTGWAL